MRAAATLVVAFATLTVADGRRWTRRNFLADDKDYLDDQCAMPIPHHDFYDIVHWCVPNSKFYNNCNFCQCNADGTAAACTNMICPPRNSQRIDYYMQIEIKGSSPPCAPLTAFATDFCNICRCDQNGEIMDCTYMDCPVDQLTPKCDSLVVHPRHDFFDETGECIPGATFFNGCKLCQCSDDGGSAVCDIGDRCDYNIDRIDGFRDFNLKCPPRRKFTIDECNECLCDANGVATCTEKSCDRAVLINISTKMYEYFRTHWKLK